MISGGPNKMKMYLINIKLLVKYVYCHNLFEVKRLYSTAPTNQSYLEYKKINRIYTAVTAFEIPLINVLFDTSGLSAKYFI